MRFSTPYQPSQVSPHSFPSGILAFLEWAWSWFYIWTETDAEPEACEPLPAYTLNRARRRISHKKLPIQRDRTFFHIVLPKTLTSTQFRERVSRLSIYGRRRVQHIRHWRNLSVPRLLGRLFGFASYAKASDFLCGYHGRLSGGVWAVHLAPD